MKHALRNWKTTLVGVGMLLVISGNVAKDPTVLMDKGTLLGGAAAVGLILGKDGDKTGIATK